MKMKMWNKVRSVRQRRVSLTFALFHVEYKHLLFAAVLQLRLAKRLPSSSRCNLRLEMLAREYHTLHFTRGNITPGWEECWEKRKKGKKNLRGQMERIKKFVD